MIQRRECRTIHLSVTAGSTNTSAGAKLKRHTSSFTSRSACTKTRTYCTSRRSNAIGEEDLPTISVVQLLLKSLTVQIPIFERNIKLIIKEISILFFKEVKFFYVETEYITVLCSELF